MSAFDRAHLGNQRLDPPPPGPVCSYCRVPIVWAVTERGKRIPLDPPLRRAGRGRFVLKWPAGDPHPTAYPLGFNDATPGRVAHFATCPAAAAFRRGKGSR